MLKKSMIAIMMMALVIASSGTSYSQSVMTKVQELEERLDQLEGKVNQATAFQFHGYARSGFLMTGNGGSTTGGEPFRAPGAGSKWRLGNEGDTYAEMGLERQWTLDDGSSFKISFLPTFQEDNDKDWTPYDGDNEATLTFRQAYAEATNTFGNGISFWAGKRYYMRSDIHVTDFYYTGPSGFGGGVGNIAIGSAKLALAWLNQSRGDSVILEDSGEYSANNMYADVTGIKLGPGGLDIQLSASWTSDGDITENDADGNPVTYSVDSSSGFNTTIQYGLGGFFGLDGGFSKVFAQYGMGTSNDFSGAGAGLWAVGPWNSYSSNVDDASRFRFGAFGVMELGEAKKWQMMPVFVYEVSDNGADTNSQQTWITAGIRPYYFVTNHFAIQGDYGFDYVDPDGGESGMLHKFSLAPTIKLGGGFWDRPEIRAFITYATWDDAWKGQVGGSAFADDTSGFIYGMQMEAWW